MSHMQYALSVWWPLLAQNQLPYMCQQRLQNRVVRLVFSLNKNDHTSEYNQELRVYIDHDLESPRSSSFVN